MFAPVAVLWQPLTAADAEHRHRAGRHRLQLSAARRSAAAAAALAALLAAASDPARPRRSQSGALHARHPRLLRQNDLTTGRRCRHWSHQSSARVGGFSISSEGKRDGGLVGALL